MKNHNRSFLRVALLSTLAGFALGAGCTDVPTSDPPDAVKIDSGPDSGAGNGDGGLVSPDASCSDIECTSCFDGRVNGGESDVDCGGTWYTPDGESFTKCTPCISGKHCYEPGDCESGICVDNAPDHDPPYGGTCE